MVFCADCVTEIADILKFCPSCGAHANKEETNQEMKSHSGQLADQQDHKQAKKECYQDLRNRVERYKPMWDKDVVIQFK